MIVYYFLPIGKYVTTVYYKAKASNKENNDDIVVDNSDTSMLESANDMAQDTVNSCN